MKKTVQIGAMGIVAAMVASGTQAALISFSASQTRIFNTSTASQAVDTNGTSIVAINVDNSAATVNGVNFMDWNSGSATANGVTMAVSTTAGAVGNMSSGYADPAFAAMIDNIIVSGFGSGDVSVDLSGLTVGQEYQLQFFFSQKKVDRTFSVQNASDALNESPVYDNLDNNWSAYYFTATWMADGTTQGFDMLPTAGQRAVLNGASLQAIPEPATIGLVGLTCSALLVFRRIFRM